jgi:hypothetical protein
MNELAKQKRELFRKIVKIIYRRAERYHKKHGDWMKLDIGDNLSLCMDSWSRAVWVYKNAKFENDVIGFSGEDEEYIGIEFGEIAVYATAYRVMQLAKTIGATE